MVKEDGVVSAENGADKLGVARNLTSPTTTTTTDKMDTSSNEGRGVVFETPPKRTTGERRRQKPLIKANLTVRGHTRRDLNLKRDVSFLP